MASKFCVFHLAQDRLHRICLLIWNHKRISLIMCQKKNEKKTKQNLTFFLFILENENHAHIWEMKEREKKIYFIDSRFIMLIKHVQNLFQLYIYHRKWKIIISFLCGHTQTPTRIMYSVIDEKKPYLAVIFHRQIWNIHCNCR